MFIVLNQYRAEGGEVGVKNGRRSVGDGFVEDLVFPYRTHEGFVLIYRNGWS